VPISRKRIPPSAEHAPLELENFLPYRLSILSNTTTTSTATT